MLDIERVLFECCRAKEFCTFSAGNGSRDIVDHRVQSSMPLSVIILMRISCFITHSLSVEYNGYIIVYTRELYGGNVEITFELLITLE